MPLPRFPRDPTPPRVLRSQGPAGSRPIPKQEQGEGEEATTSAPENIDLTEFSMDNSTSTSSSASSRGSTRPPSNASARPGSHASERPGSGRPGSARAASSGDDHSFRERVAAQYTISALNKARLRYCVFAHYFLTFAMLAKLTPCILDKFNWFILAIEELEVPEPFKWEWIWLSSFTMSILALDATKKNSIKRMKQYVLGITLLGIGPLLYAVFYWLPEVMIYLTLDYDDPKYDFYHDYLDTLAYWKGYPCGLLWFAFIIVALQVHVFATYFAYNLIKAWRVRGIPQE